MTISLAHYLRDFSEPQPVDMPGGLPDAFDGDAPLPLPEPEAPDLEAIRAAAHAEGYQAGQDEAEARFAAGREEIEAAHWREIEALTAAHDARSAELIAAKINEMAAALAEAISQQTAVILAPLLSEAVAAKAVAEMADVIRAAVEEGEVASILVRGPASLFAALEEKMGRESGLLRHIESPDLDLTAEIDGSVLVTRLSAWTASVKKVLE